MIPVDDLHRNRTLGKAEAACMSPVLGDAGHGSRHPREQQGAACWSRSPARRVERGLLFPASQRPPLRPSPRGVLVPRASWKQLGRAESRSGPRPRTDLQSHPGTVHALFAAPVLVPFKALCHCRHDTNMLDLLPVTSKLRLFITTITQWK